MKNFVHLHVHTEYSLLDGIIRLKSLAQRAVEYGMHSVAITDHGTMFGVVPFYQAMVEAGVKPIIGCEFYLAPRTIADKTPQDHEGLSHLVLLAENMKGYHNLCRLATIAATKGFYRKPRIDRELLRQHSSGLIALSACMKGAVPQLLMQGRTNEANAAAQTFSNIFGEDHFFLEVQNNGIPEQKELNRALLEMSQRLFIPLVGTNDCHYLDADDWRVHEIFLCIQAGITSYYTDRLNFDINQLNFKPVQEMLDFCKNFPGASENTIDIARRCNVELEHKSLHFPQFDPPAGKTADSFFEEKVSAGFEQRMEAIWKNNSQATDGRKKLIRYLVGKDGKKTDGEVYFVHVATLGSMKKETVIQKVGRLMGISQDKIDEMISLISDAGKLEGRYQNESTLKEMIESSPELYQLFAFSRRLVGIPCHVAKSDAYVVISSNPLNQAIPLCRLNNNIIITQYNKWSIETFLKGSTIPDISNIRLLSFQYINKKIVIDGIITKIYRKKTKKNKTMAILELDVSWGNIKVLIFPKVYESSKTLLNEEGEAILVEGRVETDETPALIAERLTRVNALDPT